MKRQIKYNCIFVYGEDGISVTFPACRGCVTCGKSDKQTKLMAEEALRFWCSIVLDNGNLLPPDLSLLELNKWVNEHKKFWGKNKWTIKTIRTAVED